MRRNFRGLFAAVAVLVGLVAVPTAVRSAESPPAVVLIHGADGSAEAALGALEELGLPVTHRMNGIGVVVTSAPSGALVDLAADRRVERVEPAPPPMQFHLDTSLRSIRLDDAATITSPGPQGFAVPYDGSGIGIAIIDMGIDPTHPMFLLPDGTSSVVRNLELVCTDRYPIAGEQHPCAAAGVEGGQTFVDATGVAGDTDGPLGGHGTHVASIAGGQRVTTADGRTLQGVAPGARLVGLGMTNEAGYTWAGIAGLNWVVENHKAPCGQGVPAAVCPPIRVVNNSWGYPVEYDEQSALDKATAAVLNAGVAIAWAAGNDGEEPDKPTTNANSHGAAEGLVSVASYNDSDRGGRDGFLSGFSSRGLPGEPHTYPDISAPGDGIRAACRPYMTVCTGPDTRDLDYHSISGTSMASPHVAGAMAVLLQANPALTPPDVERILEASAYKFRSRGKYEPDPRNPSGTTSYDKGHGLMDVAAALAMVTGRPNPPVSTYPDAYRPPAPGGAAAVGQDYSWEGGPLAGLNISGCGEDPKLGECDLHGVRVTVPDGGADMTVTIDPVGTPIGVELWGPDGSIAAGNYYVDVAGAKTLDVTVFADGVYTVAVWSAWGAAPTYTGTVSLTEFTPE